MLKKIFAENKAEFLSGILYGTITIMSIILFEGQLLGKRIIQICIYTGLVLGLTKSYTAYFSGCTRYFLQHNRFHRKMEDAHLEIIVSQLETILTDNDMDPELTTHVLEEIEQKMRTQEYKEKFKSNIKHIQRDKIIEALLEGFGVFLSALIITLPLLFIRDLAMAINTSATMAIIMLFLLGHFKGYVSNKSIWISSLECVLIGFFIILLH
ncbi:VIT1/CCC1 transporter family protein [Thermotalea metallivorans]|uniref:VIT family protein n=1 Tax=Thermotalea metallivorans TaxID=520762 RepID=A0A140L130_9FIRM|nr:VIT1/CCC1 transporter family protein [Thermotalea metallivorans]KXG74255.1 hypothetical protein AN619_24470 [Thermotalea metallivorans]